MSVSNSLIQRLEIAVSRLEALSSQRPNIAPKPSSISNNNAQSCGEIPSSVKSYDDLVHQPLKNFLAFCKKLDGDLNDVSNKIKKIFDLHRNFIWYAAGQPEPSNTTTLQSILKPIFEEIEALAALRDSKRNDPFFNHLASIVEAMQAFGWLTVKPTPAPFIKEMLDAAMFYINRVRTSNKENQIHAEWAKTLCDLFLALHTYVRQTHTTGLVWNSAPGVTPPNDTTTVTASTIPQPPPPPPPPTGLFADTKKANDETNSDRQKLFAEINKGEGITSNLKKVTDDMKTHKNPTLRSQAPVPQSNLKSPSNVNKSNHSDKPPKTELKDFKVWNVEYHKNNPSISLDVDKKQAVYIFKCENSVIQIKGKVNSVTVDGCKKTSVVFDNLLAQVEVINSQSITVQTLGSLPTISIQKTDGCQVYLSKDALNAEIVTSKSSEMNILVPKGEDGDFAEFPVPEQFKTTYCLKKKALTTVVSDIV